MATLDAVEIEASDKHTATVVWLHGLGASGHDFEPIVPVLRMPWARFVFPHAPERAVTINGGYVMPSWYDIRHFDWNRGGREDGAQVAESAGMVEALLAREKERVAADRVVLAGFSQGAALCAHVGSAHGEKLAGLLVLSGYLLNDTVVATPNEATPVHVMHGRFDDVVPILAGKRAFDALSRPGRDVRWKEYAMGHEVCPPQIADIAAWLRERLPS